MDRIGFVSVVEVGPQVCRLRSEAGYRRQNQLTIAGRRTPNRAGRGSGYRSQSQVAAARWRTPADRRSAGEPQLAENVPLSRCLEHALALQRGEAAGVDAEPIVQHLGLSLIHISEPTRQAEISYAVF